MASWQSDHFRLERPSEQFAMVVFDVAGKSVNVLIFLCSCFHDSLPADFGLRT